VKGIIRELRRRRVFTTAGLYVVGAWLILQVADVLFPGWGLPDAAVNILFIAAVAGFPLALVFGWFFNITAHGIRRTMPLGPENIGEPGRLEGNDYLVLGPLLLVAAAIISYATIEILALPRIHENGIDDRVDLPLPEKLQNSVAVLPFENIGTDPEDQVFADGVSEEIRNRLGRHTALQVIARASSLQFRNGDYGVPRISDLLGVQYLLLGTVRRQGDRIRVAAQLVVDKGTQVWSENYDRVLEDVFAIQDEIADLVATEVTPQIVASLQGSYRPSLEAYKHFVLGRDLNYRRDHVGAAKELELAIELDPEYAEAHAEYAISLLIGYPDEQLLRKADLAIATALELVPNLPRALAARGLFLGNQSPPDLVAKEAVLREALRRDPGMVDAMNWLAGTLNLQGNNKEAREWQDKAYALDPFNGPIVANMAHQVWEQGDQDRAEELLHRLAELPEPPLIAILQLYFFYAETARLVDANREAKRYLLEGGWTNLFLAHNFAMLGQMETAADLMAATARERPEQMWVRSGWVQAQAPYWQGEYGQAVEELGQARAANGISLSQLPGDVVFFYGICQALASDYSGSIETLAERLPSAMDPGVLGTVYGVDAYQALAWAHSQSGMPGESRQRLETVEQGFSRDHDSVGLVRSADLYAAARNAVLMGDNELALERLERAISAGWRDYYIQRHDPRWSALAVDPHYQLLMEKVKADVDRQREEVEKVDAEEDFPALLKQARAAREQAGQ